MKRPRTILLIAAAILMLLPAGCARRSLDSLVHAPKLEVRVHIPAPVLSKAEIGDVASDPTEEASIKDLHIWVYLSESITYTEEGTTITRPAGYCLAYLNPEDNSLSGGGDERYTIPLSDGFANACTGKHVDVYALANVASAGISASSLDASTTAAQLEALIMSGTSFGLNADGSPVTTSVPSTGLPFAGLGKNLEMSGSYPVIRVSTITLERIVCKLRFAFCQLAENNAPVSNFAVTGISIDGNLISSGEYLVNDSANAWKTDGGYESPALVLTPPAELALNTVPGDYLYTSGMSGQEYDNLITGGVRSGVLTQSGLCYLRESDKALKGHIDYTVNGVAKQSSFEMSAPGEFSRNHSWIIYAYFIGGRLVVQPTVLPWIAGHDRLSYTTYGFTELAYQKPWLRYDLDRMSWTWDDTWLAVAYGYEGGNAGKPTNSILFTLETINTNDLQIQLNNDQFILVQMKASTDSYGNLSYSYTQLGQTLTIPASPDKQTTNFYVVPVSDAVMSDPYVKVFLTEMHTGDGLPPANIPFNHNLPGDQDHTSILIYNPGRAEYSANVNIHKDSSSNEQATQYWLEEEG